MKELTPTAKDTRRVPPSISAIFGKLPILPGESIEEYRRGLRSVIEELAAKTVMQVYLAEKIFECLWWMRRYEQQKVMLIAREMTRLLTGTGAQASRSDEHKVMDLVLDPARRQELDTLYKKSGYTELSLMQAAFGRNVVKMAEYNEQIAMLAKTLSGFQASYEVLVNRQLHIERLRLHNEQLSRDIDAMEMEAVPDAGKP